MDPQFPDTIILIDENEGAIVATLTMTDQLNGGKPICVYRQKEYYHSLKDALNSLQ